MYCPVCSDIAKTDENGYIQTHYPPGVIAPNLSPGERDYHICTGSGARFSDWHGKNSCGYCAYCGSSGNLADCHCCSVKTCSKCKCNHSDGREIALEIDDHLSIYEDGGDPVSCDRDMNIGDWYYVIKALCEKLGVKVVEL